VQQGIHERRLAMVDVGDDGDVAPEAGWRSLVTPGTFEASDQYMVERGNWLTGYLPGPEPTDLD
jgi:hypothetical protein